MKLSVEESEAVGASNKAANDRCVKVQGNMYQREFSKGDAILERGQKRFELSKCERLPLH